MGNVQDPVVGWWEIRMLFYVFTIITKHVRFSCVTKVVLNVSKMIPRSIFILFNVILVLQASYIHVPAYRYTAPWSTYPCRDTRNMFSCYLTRYTTPNAYYYSVYSRASPAQASCGACGQNAQCSIIGGRPVCSCLKGYIGDPITICHRVECLHDNECPTNHICRNSVCVNLCEGTCGTGALCEVRGGVPVCTCPAGFTGDPFSHCRHFDPCDPSPCGVNTRCENNNNVPVCKCLPGYFGSPLTGCRHECDADSDCGPTQACRDFKCTNPCASCGANADCTVRNHVAVCTCPQNYYGNPLVSCQAECTQNADCPRSKPSCHYNKCVNPCDGACGVNANCELKGATPVCFCPKDMTGDPFVRCRPFEKKDLCVPNPCGANAQCQPGYDNNQRERPVCTCLPGHFGDPLRGCTRGECQQDDHCPDNKACIDYHCINPCSGQCGAGATCEARRHVAVCICTPGYAGDALSNCYDTKVDQSPSARYYRFKRHHGGSHDDNKKDDSTKKDASATKETDKVDKDKTNKKVTATEEAKSKNN